MNKFFIKLQLRKLYLPLRVFRGNL